MKSLQPNLTRRRLLAALTGLASAVAIGASAGPVAAATSLGTAVIFGDAFSTMTYKTVSNWPQQLAKKGLLKRQKIDRAFRYAPALTRTEWEQKRAGEWFSALLAESAPAGNLLISCFVDMLGDQDATLLDALARQIDLKRKRLDGGTE